MKRGGKAAILSEQHSRASFPTAKSESVAPCKCINCVLGNVASLMELFYANEKNMGGCMDEGKKTKKKKIRKSGLV